MNSQEENRTPQVSWDFFDQEEGFFEREDPITDPGSYDEQEIPPREHAGGGNVYHVYMVKEPNAQPHEDAGHTMFMEEEEEPLPQPRFFPQRRVLLSLTFVSLLLVVGLLTGGAVCYFTQAPTASVTLIPNEQPITIQTTVTLATGAGKTGGQAVPARALPIMTLSQATTVITSGTGHQDAASAHGLLTFYNGLPQVQVVSAGTLLTSSNGTQVVTDEDAVIPAASLPTSGAVTVSAHALTLGPGGNIAASSVSMPCCRENVYVQNTSAFTGGQVARSFPMVTKEDVRAAVALLKGSLQQSVQAAMQPQIRTGETLITPLPCQAKVSSTHTIGEEAAQVTVTLDDTCHGVVYSSSAMQHLLTQTLTQEATHRWGAGYRLSGGTVQSTIMQVKQQGADLLSLEVKASGASAYQFSQQQIAHFKRLLAGKSREEATRLLLEQRGVQTVSMEVKGRQSEKLPTEVSNTAVLVIVPAAS